MDGAAYTWRSPGLVPVANVQLLIGTFEMLLSFVMAHVLPHHAVPGHVVSATRPFDRVCIALCGSYDISLFHRSASVAPAIRSATRGPRVR
jgi:hypothetical protein